eukprot:1148077-Pelagomonas_calceolata.AAC.1
MKPAPQYLLAAPYDCCAVTVQFVSTFRQYRPDRSGTLYPKKTLQSAQVHSLQRAVHFSSFFMYLVPQIWQAYMQAGKAQACPPEHGLRPIHQMVLRCKLSYPSLTTGFNTGNHWLRSQPRKGHTYAQQWPDDFALL